jgi:2,3,4,5-tetrahydropyridine-2-carboxylate N-succinyltransferase
MDKEQVFQMIEDLDSGRRRVAVKTVEGWKVDLEVKLAILEYFKLMGMEVMPAGVFQYFDKIPLKKFGLDHEPGQPFVRAVPGSIARKGAYIAPTAVLMPSFVNIGAFVGAGTMVDTWATVGSCAQIGERVHLSGGVGIGGVLEPVQASPVIIEDDVFVGSRAIIVEGVVVEEGAVIGAGVSLTASTKIIDVSGSKEKIYQGRVPKNSVVIPGSYTKKFPAGEYGVGCALIIGQRKESTDKKISLNQALRDFQVSV